MPKKTTFTPLIDQHNELYMQCPQCGGVMDWMAFEWENGPQAGQMQNLFQCRAAFQKATILGDDEPTMIEDMHRYEPTKAEVRVLVKMLHTTRCPATQVDIDDSRCRCDGRNKPPTCKIEDDKIVLLGTQHVQ